MFSARTFASAPIARNTKAALSLLAMEPRMLFDGAGAVAAVNHDPIAVADCRTVATDSAIVNGCAMGGNSGGSGNVGGNGNGDNADSDPDGDTLTAVGIISGDWGGTPTGNIGGPIDGVYGTMLMQADGSYCYTPYADLALAPGECVTDTFTYTICDNNGGAASTTISLNVVGARPNQAPIAMADSRTVLSNESLSNGCAIGGNTFGDQADSDPDGDTLIVTGVVAGALDHGSRGNLGTALNGSYGQLVMNGDGSYTYTPYSDLALAPGQRVSEQFTYLICDSRGGEASASLTLTVTRPAEPVGDNRPTDTSTDTPPNTSPDTPTNTPANTLTDTPTVTQTADSSTQAGESAKPPLGSADNFSKAQPPVLLFPIGPADAPRPLISEVKLTALSPIVDPKPIRELFMMPTDHFSPFAAERILGTFQEAAQAPAEKPAPIKDDCVRTEAPAADKIIVKAKSTAVKPSVFAKPELEVKKSFSEQVKLAKKSFKPPLKVRPAPQPSDC